MSSKNFHFVALFLFINLAMNVFASSIFIPCPQDSARQKIRSDELQTIVNADQADRISSIDWSIVSSRDEVRRKRIGEIFGEGCFKNAQDYAAAALVYQHGVLPDHYFQTFLWAKKSVELGDLSEKSLMAVGLDRYLVSSGYKQMFATQASKIHSDDKCWCLEEVEQTFPEKVRMDYTKRSLNDALKWVDELNNNTPNCKPTPICKKHLKPSPAGTVPGFW